MTASSELRLASHCKSFEGNQQPSDRRGSAGRAAEPAGNRSSGHPETPERLKRISRVRLSVDADSLARRRYAALGYVDFEPGDTKGRMILELA